MVFINSIGKEINLKIVYCGAGLGGKTTNIEYIHNNSPANRRGRLISLKTDTERTLFFDFMPIDICKIKGMDLKVHLYSVPGQIFYDASRRLILRGTDGVVFVVDSQPIRMDANIESFENMKKNLLMNGISLAGTPLIIQYNKLDIPGAMPVEKMREIFNPAGRYKDIEASAKTGRGVFETFREIVKATARKL